MAKNQPFSLEATYVPVSTRASSRSKKTAPHRNGYPQFAINDR